jgi:hypothetical protein
MKASFIWLFFGLAFIGCRKTKIVEQIVEVEKKYAWSEIKDLAISFSNRAMLNAINLNDSTIGLINHNGLFAFNAKTLTYNSNLGGITGAGYASLGRQRLVTNTLLTSVSETYVQISSTTQPVSTQHATALNPSFWGDTQFVRFSEPFIKNSQSIEQVNNRYILAPFQAKRTSQQRAFAYLVPIEKSTLFGEVRLQAGTPKTLTFQNTVGLFSAKPYSLFSSGNHFYFSCGDETFRVDTMGNIKGYGAPMYSISGLFKLNDALYAINPNGKIYVSFNEGDSFSLFANTNDSIWGFLSFVSVGNNVVAFFRDQIWLLSIVGNQLEIKELQNEGLERTEITHISICADKVFITTLHGTFYRSADSFRTFK